MKYSVKILAAILIALSLLSCHKKREFKNEEDFRTWLKDKEFRSKGLDHSKVKHGQMIIPTDQVFVFINDRNTLVFNSDRGVIPYQVHPIDSGYAINFQPPSEDAGYELWITGSEMRLWSPCYNTNRNGSPDFYEGPEMESNKN